MNFISKSIFYLRHNGLLKSIKSQDLSLFKKRLEKSKKSLLKNDTYQEKVFIEIIREWEKVSRNIKISLVDFGDNLDNHYPPRPTIPEKMFGLVGNTLNIKNISNNLLIEILKGNSLSWGQSRNEYIVSALNKLKKYSSKEKEISSICFIIMLDIHDNTLLDLSSNKDHFEKYNFKVMKRQKDFILNNNIDFCSSYKDILKDVFQDNNNNNNNNNNSEYVLKLLVYNYKWLKKYSAFNLISSTSDETVLSLLQKQIPNIDFNNLNHLLDRYRPTPSDFLIEMIKQSVDFKSAILKKFPSLKIDNNASLEDILNIAQFNNWKFGFDLKKALYITKSQNQKRDMTSSLNKNNKSKKLIRKI